MRAVQEAGITFFMRLSPRAPSLPGTGRVAPSEARRRVGSVGGLLPRPPCFASRLAWSPSPRFAGEGWSMRRRPAELRCSVTPQPPRWCARSRSRRSNPNASSSASARRPRRTRGGQEGDRGVVGVAVVNRRSAPAAQSGGYTGGKFPRYPTGLLSIPRRRLRIDFTS